jgi:hypothetical protein
MRAIACVPTPSYASSPRRIHGDSGLIEATNAREEEWLRASVGFCASFFGWLS